LYLRESSFSLENRTPELVEVALLSLFFGRWFNLSSFVNRIELAALYRIEENFCSLLNTLEEAVIFGATSSSLLIRVMAKDLFAMSTLYLFLGSLVTVLGETEDGVVILSLISNVSIQQVKVHM